MSFLYFVVELAITKSEGSALICLKRRTKVVWQSADGHVISATLSKIYRTAWNVENICLTVGRRSCDLRTTVAWPFSDFFQNYPESLETSKKRCLTVSRRSPELRRISRGHSATFSKNFRIAWNVEKKWFDNRPTVALPPTTVVWP